MSVFCEMSSNNAFHLGMELMDGGSLLDSMKRCYKLNAEHTMPPAALATIAVDVLGAEFLHDELQVIHRDVKPGNILLSTSGRAKLGDLGIATEPGEVRVDPLRVCSGLRTLQLGCPRHATEWIGTKTYISPERLSGDCYSFSADIWSLRLVLVEASLGFYPIAASHVFTVRCTSYLGMRQTCLAQVPCFISKDARFATLAKKKKAFCVESCICK